MPRRRTSVFDRISANVQAATSVPKMDAIAKGLMKRYEDGSRSRRGKTYDPDTHKWRKRIPLNGPPSHDSSGVDNPSERTAGKPFNPRTPGSGGRPIPPSRYRSRAVDPRWHKDA